MATLGNTNFTADVRGEIYLGLSIGNEISDSVYIETNVPNQKALPRLKGAKNPIGVYKKTPDFTTDTTSTTEYTEQLLTVTDSMLLEPFSPDDFVQIYPEFRSDGDFTNLRIDPAFWSKVMEIKKVDIDTQISELFWQGDTTSLDAGLNRFDGIIKKATADADVIDVVNIGVITKANVVTVLEDVWAAIPLHLRKRPNYSIHMSQTDFDLLQFYNNDAKKTSVGVLSQVVEDLFLGNRIKSYVGMAKDVIIGAEGYASPLSNLVFGVWVDPGNEAAIIDKVSNYSKEWFMRIDYKLGCAYVAGEEIVMYKGAVI